MLGVPLEVRPCEGFGEALGPQIERGPVNDNLLDRASVAPEQAAQADRAEQRCCRNERDLREASLPTN
jgi:hypothetical protein